MLADVRCPHCKAGYDIEWHTEYGEPLFYDVNSITCDECDKVFYFEVEKKYSSWSKDDSRN